MPVGRGGELRRTNMRRGFEATGDGVPLWEKFDGPVFAIFGELDSFTPVQQVVPILGAALAR